MAEIMDWERIIQYLKKLEVSKKIMLSQNILTVSLFIGIPNDYLRFGLLVINSITMYFWGQMA